MKQSSVLLGTSHSQVHITHSQVHVAKSLSLSLRTHSEVWQGCALDPALFCRAVYWVLERSLLHPGVEISGDRFSDIDYADDIATLDADPVSLAVTLTNMESACCDLILHISWTKTKVQNIGAGPPAQTIMVEGQPRVEGVENFTYFGSQPSSVDGSCTERHRRPGTAVSTMQRMSHVWSLSHLTHTTRLCLYMPLVVPVLLYASETWTTTRSDLARSQAFHMRSQRRILGLHWYERQDQVQHRCSCGYFLEASDWSWYVECGRNGYPELRGLVSKWVVVSFHIRSQSVDLG